MAVYVIIFAIIAFFAVEYEVGNNKNLVPLYILAVLLALFAGLRSPYVPQDYLLYELAFNYMDAPNPVTGDISSVYEPGFIAVVYLFKSVFVKNYTVAIMLFFACVSVALTVIAIKKYSLNPYLALLIYYCNFFFLHEMTQIRIGIAIAIVLLSFPFYMRGKFLAFSIFLIVASLFHYSVLLLFSIFLFKRDQFSKAWFGALFLLSIPLGLLKLPLFNVFGLLSSADSANEKFMSYSGQAFLNLTQQANIFNVTNLLNMALVGYLLAIIPREDLEKNKYLSLFLKFNVIAIFLFCVTSAEALIAFRVSELFGIASIFLLPYLNYYLPFKRFNVFFVVAVGFAFLFINVIVGDLVQPYRLYDEFR